MKDTCLDLTVQLMTPDVQFGVRVQFLIRGTNTCTSAITIDSVHSTVTWANDPGSLYATGDQEVSRAVAAGGLIDITHLSKPSGNYPEYTPWVRSKVTSYKAEVQYTDSWAGESHRLVSIRFDGPIVSNPNYTPILDPIVVAALVTVVTVGTVVMLIRKRRIHDSATSKGIPPVRAPAASSAPEWLSRPGESAGGQPLAGAPAISSSGSAGVAAPPPPSFVFSPRVEVIVRGPDHQTININDSVIQNSSVGGPGAPKRD